MRKQTVKILTDCFFHFNAKKNATPKGIAFSALYKRAYAPNFSITAVVTPVLENPPSWNKFCIVT